MNVIRNHPYMSRRTIKAWETNGGEFLQVIDARDGYFVRGQRNTDYNWSLLAEFDNMDSAKEYIKSIRTDPVQQLVYGPDGYGIRI